jgi:hypothetical protein
VATMHGNSQVQKGFESEFAQALAAVRPRASPRNTVTADPPGFAPLIPRDSYVRVDHRRAHLGMPEQFLDGPDVIPVLEQMRRKRMPERMTAGLLRNSCLPHRIRGDRSRVKQIADISLVLNRPAFPARHLRYSRKASYNKKGTKK